MFPHEYQPEDRNDTRWAGDGLAGIRALFRTPREIIGSRAGQGKASEVVPNRSQVNAQISQPQAKQVHRDFPCVLATLNRPFSINPHINPHMWGRHLPTLICILSSIELKQAAMPGVNLRHLSYGSKGEQNESDNPETHPLGRFIRHGGRDYFHGY
jgi:hypothetical protein